MVQFIITPWRDHQELLRVRQQFYSSEGHTRDTDLRQAVDRVSLWMQRGGCPHSVESTALITSAILNDNPRNSDLSIRAAYSAAFSRFVTAVCDGEQKQGHKMSMYSIAKIVELPATFVELRHAATHEPLPSLSKLRLASQKALTWIWGYFWGKLSDDTLNSESCFTYVQRLLREKDSKEDTDLDLKKSRWSRKEVLATLLDLSENAQEPEVLLGSLKIYDSLLNENETLDTDGSGKNGETEAKSMEEIMAEVAKMDEDLEESTSNKALEEPIQLISAAHDGRKGWARWEGPWKPAPIGTIIE